MSERMLQVENVLFTIVMLLYFAAMILYFIFIAVQKEMISRIAIIIQGVGFVLHTAALICRGIGAGRLPMTNQYEFATSFAWGICLVSLIFILKFHFPVLGTFASPVMFLIIGYAAMQSKDVHELMPALKSNWLGFHVSTAIIAYGSFGVSFVLALIFLVTCLKLHYFFHRGLRYVAYSFGGVGLMSLAIPGWLYFSKFYNGFNLQPHYFYHFAVTLVVRLLRYVMAAGVFWLVLTVILAVIISIRRAALMKG